MEGTGRQRKKKNFQGTSIAADFSGGASDYIRVIIDDDALGSIKIPTPAGLATLASGLSDTNHTIEIVKETDQGRMTCPLQVIAT